TIYGVPTGNGVFLILQCGKNHKDACTGTLPAGQAYAGEPADEAERCDTRKKPVHAVPPTRGRAPLPRAAIATESKNPANEF
ncbi:MAG: hypothetical protein RR431_11905, partial [Clostridia bacterium]